MDQARLNDLLQSFVAKCNADRTFCELSAFAGQPELPIVVLVHGIGGNQRHWSDPASINVSDTWLFDINAKPPSGKGLLSSPPYNPASVISWTRFLESQGISYVNFSQCRPGDLIQFAVDELVTILTNLEQTVFTAMEGEGQTASLDIVAHSRGGLVTRLALKQLGSSGVPHLRKVITLCTPHHGSYMPRISNDYNDFLHNQIKLDFFGNHLGPLQGFMDNTIEKHVNDLANHVREAMLHSFGVAATSPGFSELIPGSSMLQGLEQNEQPLPGVQYYGFGGSNPTFVNLFFGIAGQVIPVFSTASAILVEILGKATGANSAYGGLAELSQGDSAVGLISSHWPDQFQAAHQDFHLNHMQALIDKNLQNAVAGILKG